MKSWPWQSLVRRDHPERAPRGRHGARKCVAPERLEPRNAPGAMLPLFAGTLLLEDEIVWEQTSGEARAFDLGSEGSAPQYGSGLPAALPPVRDAAFNSLDAHQAAVVEENCPDVSLANKIDPADLWPTQLGQSALADPVPESPQADDKSDSIASDESPASGGESGSNWNIPAGDSTTPSDGGGGPRIFQPMLPVQLEPVTRSAPPRMVKVDEEIPVPPHETDPGTTPTSDDGAGSGPLVIPQGNVDQALSQFADPGQLSETEVSALLDRATRVASGNNAIITVVDRGGRLLGVHVEQGVIDTVADMDTLVFAIDGAAAKARTAAFFSNNQAALTSRTVRFISQTTIAQREVESNPNSADPTVKGPGFVAPIGLGGHFPPEVLNTAHVDLFAIEHTNRDSIAHPGVDRVKAEATVDGDGNVTAVAGDDILLGLRFGADFIAGQEIDAPESYGLVSGLMTEAQSRGLGTLPGGVPIYRLNSDTGQQELAGGIGVFFPGPDGMADFEQNFQAGTGQTETERTNAPLVLEAEYIATVVALNNSTVAGLPPVADIAFPPLPGDGRIDLVGITLESFGPHPLNITTFVPTLAPQFTEGATTGARMQINPDGDLAREGERVPEGWLVAPKDSGDGLISAAEVEKIILDGVAEAGLVRSAIRLPVGQRSRMVLSVADKDGTILGLFRMPDSTVFSVDVAVAKARNVVYYADPVDLLPIDQFDFDNNAVVDLPAGTALTNRTFRYLAEPRFPSGVDGSTPPPFSILNNPSIDPLTGENIGAPAAADSFTSVLGFDAFNPGSNFHEPVPASGAQNGVVFFPGSSPLYDGPTLVAGLGVSGDGVDQDDVVTFVAAGGFLPRNGNGAPRADEFSLDGARLPFQKFLRNPHG